MVALSAMTLAGCASEMPPVGMASAERPKPPVRWVSHHTAGSTTGNYLAGRFAQKLHDYDAASSYLSQALGSDRANRDLLRRAFLANLAGGNFEAARRNADRISKLTRGAPLATIVLVVADVEAGRFDSAEARLGAVKRRGISTFVTPLLRAWIRAGRGDTDAAVAAMKPISKMSGFAVLYDLHAGLLYDLAGRTAEAERHYLGAAKRTRRSTLRIVQALGSLYERSGRPQLAAERYQQYLKENPESQVLLSAVQRVQQGGKAPRLVSSVREGLAEAFFNVASTLTQENAVEMALIYGRLALELRQDLALARMLVGGILESLGRQEDAIKTYKSVVSTSPLWWSARLRMAASLDALGREDEAIEHLRSMSRESTTRVDALINLGDILRSKKRFAESVDAYDAAVQRIGPVDKRHWTLLYSRGIALERSKQWSRAEEDFVTALKLNPDQPYVLNYLGYSWVDQGINLERAQKMIKRAVELRPNDGYIVDSLGWVLFRVGSYKEAVRKLERAVELRPQDPTINDHLGDAYWRVGRAVEARFQWHRALSLDPEADQLTIIRGKIVNGLTASASAEK